jgi:hypothetical protein
LAIAVHDQPWFEGEASRRHRAVPIWRLMLKGYALRMQGRGLREGETRTLVQFLGFPRSGHSVVGALLDAHPDAVVAHELDLLGLVAKGIPVRSALALAEDNSRRFAEQGRFWNGYSYEVAGGFGGAARRLRVIGDKKGDRALDALVDDPSLASRLARETGLDPAWIVVVRNPFDNIATMELRRGRTYDRLRVAHGGGERFEEKLRETQGRDIAEAVSADTVDAYARRLEGLAKATDRLEAEGGSVIVVHHDEFSSHPVAELARIAGRLGLEAEPGWLEGASQTVRPASRSRDRVRWSTGLLERVERMIGASDLLAPYREKEGAACVST